MYNVVFKKLLDIGDFIGVKGYVFRTQMGEISIHAEEITVLSKSLRPLPVVKMKDGKAYDAFTDPEQRYRQRYVNIVVNKGIKDIFIKRTKMFNSMREYFNSHGYIEVETPILRAIPGGALYPPVHHPPQCARHSLVFAHRRRTLSQTPHCRRLRGRIRILKEFPQRGHGPHPQP